jgi:hypothetical protein
LLLTFDTGYGSTSAIGDIGIGMGRATAMLEALCHAEGIDPSSSLMEAECTVSALLLPDGPPSEDVDSLDT